MMTLSVMIASQAVISLRESLILRISYQGPQQKAHELRFRRLRACRAQQGTWEQPGGRVRRKERPRHSL